MKIYKTWYAKLILLVIISITLLLALNQKDYFASISKSQRLFNGVYRQLISHYVDPIKVAEFTETAIKNMVNELDPYTVFLTREEREPIEMLSKGNYGGVGIQISKRNDTLTAVSPIEGGPAERAGILPGDQIIKVDSVKTKDLSLSEAARKIRGKVGTPVKLTIRRPGVSGTTVYALQRQKIKVPVLSYAGMLDEETGYVRLTGFSKGSSRELYKQVKKFVNQPKFSQLILDLRGNPGGLLEEALQVAEFFTQPGDTLLYTKGRTKNANRVFLAKKQPLLDAEIKLAVLINKGSASASEIVAGIIQDHDRGVILGHPSFGKGLVQGVVRIDEQHSLKITNAKYYIPSGRLIQRPGYVRNQTVVTESYPEDSIFYTRNGREIKGAGGIEPDITVTGDKLTPYVIDMWRNNKFYSFAIEYKSDHGKMPHYSQVDEQMIAQFKDYLLADNYHYTFPDEAQLKKLAEKLYDDENFKHLEGSFSEFYTVWDQERHKKFQENKEAIQQGLKGEFATLQGGVSMRVEATIQQDKTVEKALQVLSDQDKYSVTLGYLGQ